MIIRQILSTAVCILIGWLLIEKVSKWIGVRGRTAKIIKVVGVVVIIGSLLAWV